MESFCYWVFFNKIYQFFKGYYEYPQIAPKDLMFQTTPDHIFLQYQRFLPFLENSNNRLLSESKEENKTIQTDPNYFKEDDWTLEFILQQFWRKYPNILIICFVSIFFLIITTVWLCGRHVKNNF